MFYNIQTTTYRPPTQQDVSALRDSEIGAHTNWEELLYLKRTFDSGNSIGDHSTALTVKGAGDSQCVRKLIHQEGENTLNWFIQHVRYLQYVQSQLVHGTLYSELRNATTM